MQLFKSSCNSSFTGHKWISVHKIELDSHKAWMGKRTENQQFNCQKQQVDVEHVIQVNKTKSFLLLSLKPIKVCYRNQGKNRFCWWGKILALEDFWLLFVVWASMHVVKQPMWKTNIWHDRLALATGGQQQQSLFEYIKSLQSFW